MRSRDAPGLQLNCCALQETEVERVGSQVDSKLDIPALIAPLNRDFAGRKWRRAVFAKIV